MKVIHKIIEHLSEEIEGAMSYAEQYIECKAKGNANKANRYKEMAYDELKHAEYIHEFGLADVEEIKKIMPLSEKCEEAWEASLKHYREKMAMVRHMLSA